MFNSEEEQPRAKKRKEETERSLESCLTDDLVLNCVARVSRSDLATLSLASKSYRSLVASPDLYKIRSLIGRTETHIYVCVRTPGPDPTLGWYILRRSETSSGLIPIPSSSSALPLEGSSVVVLDWGIFVIGGFIKGEERTGNVWLLDCRTHTWRLVPSMGVGRAYGAAGVVDGKIYVFGGYDVVDDHWGQVFDPKTQTWDTLPMPKVKIVSNKNIHDSFVRDHKVYAVDGMYRTYYYSPREGKWGSGNRGEQKGSRRDWCMVDNLIYCLSRNGTVFWCEPDELDLLRGEEMMNTKEVKGLGSSLKTSLLLSRVVHVGDQILHRWEQTKIRTDASFEQEDKASSIYEFLYPAKDELPDDKEMTIFDHLEELRERIFVSVLAVGAAIAGCFAYSKDLIVFLEAPVKTQGVRFLQLAPGEFFFTTLKVSGYCGLLLGSPVILYEIIAFVLPGLTRAERRFLGPIVFGSSLLFYAGLAFSYWVLTPAALNFFVNYAEGVVESLWSIDQYFEFVLVLMFSTGLSFQVPVIQLLLGQVGVVSGDQMLSIWKYVVVGAVVVAAVVTPSTDPVTQMLLATPLLGLYLGGAWMVKLTGR